MMMEYIFHLKICKSFLFPENYYDHMFDMIFSTNFLMYYLFNKKGRGHLQYNFLVGIRWEQRKDDCSKLSFCGKILLTHSHASANWKEGGEGHQGVQGLLPAARFGHGPGPSKPALRADMGILSIVLKI